MCSGFSLVGSADNTTKSANLPGSMDPWCFSANAAYAPPRVQAPAEALRFCAWSPGEPLVAGLFGTRQPADCRDCLPDVVVMPCLGFDPRGYRLGYGGGYYDRTLARIAAGGRPCVAIGVAHDEAEISGFEPHVHDRALDWILTESRRLAGAAAPG